MALIDAPRHLRFAAVDVLPELVSGLSVQIEELVSAMNRRQATAESLLRNLEDVADAGDSSGRWVRLPTDDPSAASSASSSALMSAAASSSGDRAETAPSPVAHQEPARTEVYPGTSESTTQPPRDPTADDTRRHTVPIGSGALQSVKKGN